MAESLILECNDRAYRKKREGKTCHHYVCKNMDCFASISLCADDGVLRESLEVGTGVSVGLDHMITLGCLGT